MLSLSEGQLQAPPCSWVSPSGSFEKEVQLPILPFGSRDILSLSSSSFVDVWLLRLISATLSQGGFAWTR